jgi:hypothetical protein
LDDCTRDIRRGEDDIPDIPALFLRDNMKHSFHDWLYDELKRLNRTPSSGFWIDTLKH